LVIDATMIEDEEEEEEKGWCCKTSQRKYQARAQRGRLAGWLELKAGGTGDCRYVPASPHSWSFCYLRKCFGLHP
jgi:hypothetical protein